MTGFQKIWALIITEPLIQTCTNNHKQVVRWLRSQPYTIPATEFKQLHAWSKGLIVWNFSILWYSRFLGISKIIPTTILNFHHKTDQYEKEFNIFTGLKFVYFGGNIDMKIMGKGGRRTIQTHKKLRKRKADLVYWGQLIIFPLRRPDYRRFLEKHCNFRRRWIWKKESNTLDQITCPAKNWSDIEHYLESKTTKNAIILYFK